MKFESTYTLTKTYYRECFDQSEVLRDKSFKRFSKAFFLFLFGMGFYYLQQDSFTNHLGQFFLILAFVESLSVIYARGWWVTRQMFSKASGNDVNLCIDDEGIDIQSDFVKQTILWTQISDYKLTDKGIIIFLKQGGNSYLSKSVISEEAWKFLLTQVQK